ncbi:MAG: BON domain-containing protein [Methanomicrobiales archaeon]|nr:BON domain-containing protein [Methanomicrobiales archaeon]
MVLSDEEIKKMVVEELYWDDRIDASKIMVKVDKGKAVLTGSVPSYMARDNAERAVSRVRGVTEVDNNLTVLYAGFPNDEETRFSIQNLITANPGLRKEDIRVAVGGGIVTLEGSVTSYWKKTQARRVACGADGVLDVINKLTVVPTEKVSDRAIAEDVIAAIERNVYADIKNINVEVRNGVVILTGSVPSLASFDTAQDAAEFTRGVLNVINDLVIRKGPVKSEAVC